MANLVANPWTLTTSDVAAPFAISSIVRNGQRSATVTTGTSHGYSANQPVSIQSTLTNWNGGYRIEFVPTATTFVIRIEDWRSTLANLGAVGTVYAAAYYGNLVRGEQMLWNNPTAGSQMNLTDVAGNTVWAPEAVSGGTLTYGKLFWINGLVLITMATGTLQITIN